ncbi:MAG: cyclic nucleotide-binding domain-containing protein [Synechococcaceae cyanobacterium SM2_3_60]|nr:cyclic nucleotide-binding domain-containing protein [Synechococcaceae cyanobacterium SM2_3_60]
MSLAALPLLRDVAPEVLTWFQSKAQVHNYPSGRAVFVEDVSGNAIYFIRSGWLKICRNQTERQITLAVLGPGEVFGEMSILDQATRSSDAIALTPIQLLSLNAADFRALVGASPQF